MLWGRIFILDFAYISRNFLSHPSLFPGNEEISAPPPCKFLIGIYKFYENWSTKTFRKLEKLSERKRGYWKVLTAGAEIDLHKGGTTI
jgi:hypothetical protein